MVRLTLVRYGSWRWMVAATLAAALSIATLLSLRAGTAVAPDFSAGPTSGAAPAPAAVPSPLDRVAARHPARNIEVIVQVRESARPAAGERLIAAAGGKVTRDLHIINGMGARLPAARADRLETRPAVKAVSLNTTVKTQGWRWHRRTGDESVVDSSRLQTSYDLSVRANWAWGAGYTGDGVGVAVVDTGIQGNLPDFIYSRADQRSRVVASAVVNPGAGTAGDSFGHGTYVAGIIGGDGTNRPKTDPLYGRYIGVAPDANLISVKVSDEQGDATVLDVIDGLQFVVDHKSDYNIRVVNLSLKSTDPESYRTDPLDAAAEAAWNSGVVVVAAAGNQGTSEDAVSYAPANDPYVITVGAVDDQDTRGVGDDVLTSWSSRGRTQDGFAKPDLVAPGAHIVSTIAPGSEYTRLCPTCVTDGEYFKAGGTSMAAAVVSGGVANLLEARPNWSPNQVKTQLTKRTRPVEDDSGRLVDGRGDRVFSGDGSLFANGEMALDMALFTPPASPANAGLTPNDLIDPATGQIDYSRASWSRASWSDAIDPLRASWSRASWSRASWSRASWSATVETCTDLERASWSRASWSRASWSRASWSRASWSVDGLTSPDLTGEEIAQIDQEIAAAKQECDELLAQIDPTRASWSRASWSRASWSRASWSTSFDK